MYRITTILIFLLIGFSAIAQPTKIGLFIGGDRYTDSESIMQLAPDKQLTFYGIRGLINSKLVVQKFLKERLAIKPHIGYTTSSISWSYIEEDLSLAHTVRAKHLNIGTQLHYYLRKDKVGFQVSAGPTIYTHLSNEGIRRVSEYDPTEINGGFFPQYISQDPFEFSGYSSVAAFFLTELSVSVGIWPVDSKWRGDFVMAVNVASKLKGILKEDSSRLFYRGVSIGINAWIGEIEEEKELIEN